MAHNTTVSLLNELAEGHDEEVHEWRDALVKTIDKPSNQEVWSLHLSIKSYRLYWGGGLCMILQYQGGRPSHYI